MLASRTSCRETPPTSPPPLTSQMASSKRGLAWPVENSLQDILPFTKPSSKTTWIYNWSPHPTPAASSLHFTPMQWNHVNIETLQTTLLSPSVSKPTHILGFNEPELPSQSNLTPEHAAEIWLQYIQPLRCAPHNIQAGSPGISSAPHGIAWLQKFLSLVRAGGSDVDFYCLHWYGETLGGFYDYLWSTFYQLGGPEGGKKVWVTEFGCTNWSETTPLGREVVEEFARASWKYLDQEVEWVERYAWFGAMRDAANVGPWVRLVSEDGKLTDLGREYRGF